jgi:sugar lactone lactonase YvrE
MKCIFITITMLWLQTICLMASAQLDPAIIVLAGKNPYDKQPADEAKLFDITDLAITPGDEILFSGYYNHGLSKIDREGMISVFPSVSTRWPHITAFAYNANGEIFYIANNRLYKLGLTGQSSADLSGDPLVTEAALGAQDLLFDPEGCLYICNAYKSTIYKMSPTRAVIRVAGSEKEGFSGDGGPATQAQLDQPEGIARGLDGSLYIADTENHRIREVSPGGIISTLAGNPLYQAGGFSGDGGPATQAHLYYPTGIAVEGQGVVYVADSFNQRVRKITPDGMISTLAGTGEQTLAGGGLYDPEYIGFIGNGKFSGDNGPARLAALNQPNDLTVDSSGNLYVSDVGNRRIRKIDRNGIIATVVGGDFGEGNPAIETGFYAPYDPSNVAFDLQGRVYIADAYSERVQRIGLDGNLETVAGGGDEPIRVGISARRIRIRPIDVQVDSGGNLYVLSQEPLAFLLKINPDGTLMRVIGNGKDLFTDSTRPVYYNLTSYVTGLGLGPDDSIYIAMRKSVWKVLPDNTFQKIAGRLTTGLVPSVDATKDDGGQALGAELWAKDIAVDAKGDLYIADEYNHRIRKIDMKTGIITTIAGRGPTFYAQGGYSGDGGPATQAELKFPTSVAVDSAGNVYFGSDRYTPLRKIDSQGIISTVVGARVEGLPTEVLGKPNPLIPGFIEAKGIAVDPNGNLLVADTGNQQIRKITRVAAPGIIPQSPPLLKGDLTGDGKVEVSDVVAALEALTGGRPNLSDIEIADMNEDGRFGIQDVVLILKKSAGISNT